MMQSLLHMEFHILIIRGVGYNSKEGYHGDTYIQDARQRR